jgi:5,6-dimethylbenzimidazole synthase
VSKSPHAYPQAERDAIYRAIRERRDVRHFTPGGVEPETLARLLEAAHAAPSVGLSQPWRFLRITEPALREAIHALVQQERARTAEAIDTRGAEFLRLKVEGLRECAELFVVAVQDGGPREVFGRRTLPEMDLASTACAIQNLWLAARAEGLGLGWVSMFEPDALARLLALPADVKPVAVLCLGQVERFGALPMLAEQVWRQPRPLAELLHDNHWPEAP